MVEQEWFKLLDNLLGPDPDVDRKAVFDFLVRESQRQDLWRPAAAHLLGCSETEITRRQRHTIKSAVWLNLVGDEGAFVEDEGFGQVTVRRLLEMLVERGSK